MHKITGFSVIFAFLHMLLIPSDISVNLPLRFWMLSLGVLALIGWAYKLLLYNRIAFKSEYSIVEVARDESVLKITMVATKNQIRVNPGQFAFFSFRSAVKAITKEAHPFTILNAEGNTLTLAVKYLGDFTYRLQQLVVGDKVKVAGPHGSFGESYLNSPKDAVWIAGGIGVTPFVNLVTYAQLQRFEKPTIFYYTTKEEDKTFHPSLMQQVATLPISYHYVSSEKQGRLMPEKIVAGLTKAPQLYDYFICGPKSLLVSTVQYLQKIGINSSQIHVEDFDFKDFEI
jgi:predicted ferric reductase